MDDEREEFNNLDNILHNESIISQFTKQATPYARLSQHSNQYGLEIMLRLVEPKKDDSVLDIACGSGIVSCELAKYASHVVGVDITPAMIEQARKLQQQRHLNNISWKIGDITKALPFEDSTFSIVITRYSFHHLLEPRKVLEEMKRVSDKHNGKVVIIDVTPEPEKADAYNHMEKLRDPSHVRALTLAELKNMISEIGLVNLKIGHHNLEMELEDILQASYPNTEDDLDKIRELFRQDLQKNNLGVKIHLKDNKAHFYFPISMIIANRKDV